MLDTVTETLFQEALEYLKQIRSTLTPLIPSRPSVKRSGLWCGSGDISLLVGNHH